MPVPDPIPPLGPLKRQFFRLMRWGALFSLVDRGDRGAAGRAGRSTIHIHMLIATGLGVGLSVLLGIALMTLVFLSNRAGHDADAADHQTERRE